MNDRSNQSAVPKLDHRKLDPRVTRVLRQRGVDEVAMAQMSAVEIFEEYCGFHGLLKMGAELAGVLDAARVKETMDANAPAAKVAFANACAKRNVSSMAPALLEVLVHIRSCERLPPAQLKHAA